MNIFLFNFDNKGSLIEQLADFQGFGVLLDEFLPFAPWISVKKVDIFWEMLVKFPETVIPLKS